MYRLDRSSENIKHTEAERSSELEHRSLFHDYTISFMSELRIDHSRRMHPKHGQREKLAWLCVFMCGCEETAEKEKKMSFSTQAKKTTEEEVVNNNKKKRNHLRCSPGWSPSPPARGAGAHPGSRTPRQSRSSSSPAVLSAARSPPSLSAVAKGTLEVAC